MGALSETAIMEVLSLQWPKLLWDKLNPFSHQKQTAAALKACRWVVVSLVASAE